MPKRPPETTVSVASSNTHLVMNFIFERHLVHGQLLNGHAHVGSLCPLASSSLNVDKHEGRRHQRTAAPLGICGYHRVQRPYLCLPLAGAPQPLDVSVQVDGPLPRALLDTGYGGPSWMTFLGIRILLCRPQVQSPTLRSARPGCPLLFLRDRDLRGIAHRRTYRAGVSLWELAFHSNFFIS